MNDGKPMGQDGLKAANGAAIAKALGLRKARRPDGKPFDPPRWSLGREYGTKTAIGVYAVVCDLARRARELTGDRT
jgi:hypothetical protein